MNFADLRNTQDTKMQLFGLVSSIEGVTYTAGKGTPRQRVQIRDDGGEQNYVTIYPGNSPAMDGSLLGREQSLACRQEKAPASTPTTYTMAASTRFSKVYSRVFSPSNSKLRSPKVVLR